MLSITDKFKVTLLQAITKNNHPKNKPKKIYEIFHNVNGPSSYV